MARTYLSVGDRQIPVSDEERRKFNELRDKPKKLALFKATLIAAATPPKKSAASTAVPA